jgi:tetratricopeptide (TPR) repeat protein
VAVKLIKPGMDSRAVLARFEAERQALALMDHPNIAKVLDAGATPVGRPYFVMELVKGVPITRYCDDHRLGVRDRLVLFADVCRAVQHAHQKGVIHRDLKPNNVLVAPYDGKPVVKVIDFGVAKAAGQPLTERTLVTGLGAVVGTPEYMSPEQAELNNLDIDTRSDIYALGVLLYELLTGTTPLTSRRVKEAALLEVLRVIREEEPPRPSVRLSTTEELPSIAAVRSVEPAGLSRLLRGELDWIVMKALEKDRNRRYETANGLARDIQRHLADEVVEARPPSTGYRLRKFVRRNKGRVLATALVLLALVAGTIGTTWGYLSADRARKAEARRAESERLAKLDAQQQKAAAEAAEKAARGEAEKVKTINAFLTQDLLSQAEPANNAVEDKVTLLEVLDRAAAKVGERFAEQPELERELRDTIGATYHGLASWEKAEAQYRAMLESARRQGEESVETYRAMSGLAHILNSRGQVGGEALAMAETAAKGLESRLGPDHERTLSSMNILGRSYQDAGKLDLALRLYEETLRRSQAKLGPDNPRTLAAINNMASGYRAAGKLDQALPLFDEALRLSKVRLGSDHPHTLVSMGNLARGYQAAGKLDQALPLFDEALRLSKVRLGREHPDTLYAMGNLASGYRDAGKLDQALPLLDEALRLKKAKLGPDHPNTLYAMSYLAAGYRDAGKLDQALPLLEEALRLSKAKLGSDHPHTLIAMGNLAQGYRDAEKLEQALPLFEESLRLEKARLGPDHPTTLKTMGNLARGYRDAGKFDRALPLFEDALRLSKARLGPDHPDTLIAMDQLAQCYWSRRQLDKSVPLYEEAVKRQSAAGGRQNPQTLRIAANLGVNYKDAGRLAEALPLLEESYRAGKKNPELRWVGTQLLDAYAQAKSTTEVRALVKELLDDARRTLPPESPALAGMLAQLGAVLLDNRSFADTEPLLRECLSIRERKQPDDWTTFNTQSLLGGALLGQNQVAAAEPLLLAGYEGMKKREKTMQPANRSRLANASGRLVDLYTATKRPDELKRWQAERALYKEAGN